MTAPQSVLTTADFAKFKAKDEQWFLDRALDTVREHCGWHIAPIVSEENVTAQIGNKGVIPLNTLQLVSVEGLRLFLPPGPVAAVSGTYLVKSSGSIELYGWYARSMRGVEVQVDFTHGYEVCPGVVQEVGFEVAARALEKPAGVVTDMTRGPTRLKFAEFGFVLSEDQKDRLGPYTLVRV